MILRGLLLTAATLAAALTPSVAGFGVKVSTFLPPKFTASIVKSSSSTTSTRTTALNMAGVEITMPALSSTMKEGKVVSWLKSEGDSISAGEAIMVVESDKADMDVEAFEDGILAKIFVEAGEMAPVGQAVAIMASTPEEIDQVLANYAGGSSAATANAPAASVPVANGGKTAATASSSSSSMSVVVSDENIQVVYMPALSSTMVEGKIVSWLVSVGDHVQPGDVIMVVESDKADMDVEAFEDGYLAEIMVEEGSMANVGAPVAVFVATEQDLAQYQSNSNNKMMTSTVTTSSSSSQHDTARSSSPVLDSAATASAITAPTCEYRQIDMPALSSTMKEGKVVSWLKSEGDAISAGEAIMVVESDKADMDVEAFEDGYLAAILTPEGQSGAVGQPVALVAVEASDIPALQAYAAQLQGAPVAAVAAAAPAAAAAAPAAPKAAAAAPKPAATAAAAATGDRAVASPLAKKKAEELGVDLSTVVGSGPEGRITAADVEEAAKGGAKAAAKPAAAGAAPAKPAWVPAPGVIAATPTARALAKKAKLDLSKIKGTGEFGRVTADDVLIATGEKQPEKPVKAASSTPSVELPDGFVPFTGMQRGVSKNMVATLTTPIFRVSRDIEMDKFDALYQNLKPKGVTVSAMLAKAVALALEKYPIINSAYSDKDGGGILFKKDINIAMAVAIDGGLITPTLKYANERSVVELGENWKELVAKAKAGKLSPDEYQSGTFAISNLGMFGIPQFDAILPPGMGGILAVGSTQEFIVPDSAAILGMKKVKKMTVTLTADHRQIYGADGALFLQELANVMENQLDRLSK